MLEAHTKKIPLSDSTALPLHCFNDISLVMWDQQLLVLQNLFRNSLQCAPFTFQLLLHAHIKIISFCPMNIQ